MSRTLRTGSYTSAAATVAADEWGGLLVARNWMAF
jgi:hypothetical protein